MSQNIFDINYKDEYNTKIEFNTQINEKQKGYEQRYPVWTYPKRVFELSFDKSPEKRKQLEDFFISVLGAEGTFLFTWATEKGGNNVTYTAWFDEDSFEQSMLPEGFSNSDLKIATIDKEPVQTVGNLDFYYDVEYKHSLNFSTIVDSLLTAQNSRKGYFNRPKREWTLKFKNKPEIRKKIEAFFIAKRGKFRAFDWKWEKKYGGDDNTYRVRFDTDILDVAVTYEGFGEIELKIKEVFETENPLSEVEKDEIIPRKLLNIDLKDGPIHILDNETLESLVIGGVEFLGAPLDISEIKKDNNASFNSLSVKLSNVGLQISGIIAKRGDVITNAPAVLSLVFLNVNTNKVLETGEKILFTGLCNNLSLDLHSASIDIETNLGGFDNQMPLLRYRATCQVRKFKDCRCKYNGSETACDRTLTRCIELGNVSNFAGFPTLYNEMVVKV